MHFLQWIGPQPLPIEAIIDFKKLLAVSRIYQRRWYPAVSNYAITHTLNIL